MPEVAVEAVLLRSGNERINVTDAFEELDRFSLIETVSSEADNMRFVGVPLAAAMYGRRKLDASPLKAAIEEDRKLLVEFGAGKREDVHRGVYPRIERLVRTIAYNASTGTDAFENYIPVLDYLAAKVPSVYPRLAELVLEVDKSRHAVDRAKNYLQRFLEEAGSAQKREIWMRLADLCRSTGNSIGEVHALSEAALSPTADAFEVGNIANRLNNRIRELKGLQIEDAWSPEMLVLLRRFIEAMEKHINDLSATDCSRLAWLHLNVKNEDRAREIARIGIQRDHSNEHCRNLVERLTL